MLKTQSRPITQDAHRLLNPAQALARLRPVKLEAIARELRDVAWLAMGLELLRFHFPANLPRKVSGLEWSGTLRAFLILVEEHWFPVDWGWLDYLWESWMSVDPEEGEDYIREMAAYLEYIPVKFHNYGEEQLINWVAEEHPWFTTLAGILSDRVDLSSDFLIDLEIYDGLAGLTRAELWHRLNRPGAFEEFPEPLCWLPELCRMAVCETGNPLLDGWRDTYERAFDEWEPFRWDEDIEEVREMWREAEPVVEHWAAFDTWINQEHPWNLQKAIYLILGWHDLPDENDDDGLWLDPAAARQNTSGGDDDEQ